MKSLVLMIAILFGSVLGASAEEKFPSLTALGPPPTNLDNPQSVDKNGYPKKDDPKVQLGKMLYFDPRLSGDASISCGDCHNPTLGWTEGQALCRGYPGTVHWRNCQSVVNAAYYNKLFWAGSSTSLEAQARGAARGAVAGNGEEDMMEERLAQIPEYIKRFKEVFGTELPQISDAWKAIAAFERTVYQVDTPFDRYMRGEKNALSEKARQGLELFQGKAGCIQCHNGPFFTDEKYHNLGVPENAEFDEDPQRQITFRFEQYAKGVPENIYRTAKTDLGLYYRMKRKEDMGKFRTPTLRYLLYTPPYMHNGIFFTLEEVIDFYNKGGGEDQIKKLYGFSTKTKRLKPLNLTDREKEALIAFLESLSGEEIIVKPPKLPDYAVMK
ncbi:MAG: cytochrome-c peroxidase [Candidatus Binatia bacterium]